ncbi:hypothetical protein A1O1_08775 [Capronia coronata CBS 617.96]|uniref:Phytanoyl-CoA dioxygenase n=1 Tax=Capronia coronata CBS 617.96 TaxID=1182541 RepID=W9XRA2_9EURO|nr:uncharacterized protein A1O1_08775 [Capronia coronata CBS 617.96]EXJ79511.1 hypothetical protein A1O1_08775 [Capronia coronata CBS 617.96]
MAPGLTEIPTGPKYVSVPQKSQPKVQSLPIDAPLEDVINAIKLAGGVIIRNFISQETLGKMEKEIRARLEQDGEWGGEFFPRETRRCTALIAHSPTTTTEMIAHPLYMAVAKAFLRTEFWCWQGTEKTQTFADPQLNLSSVVSVRPGSKDQPLHRDDMTHLVVNPALDAYPDDLVSNRRDSALGLFVAGTKTTKENGATRFIPGSHLWAHERAPDESLAYYAELEPGDAFIMLASCYHGGSANTTADEERLVYSCFMTRGYLRQEENQYLSVPLETMKKYPPHIQKMVG